MVSTPGFGVKEQESTPGTGRKERKVPRVQEERKVPRVQEEIEKLICSDASLAELDVWLSEAYKAAQAEGAGMESLRNDQRRWIRESRDRCADVPCLRGMYAKRIYEIEPSVTFDVPDERSEGSPNQTVLGRCHMLNCWWWGIDEVKPVLEKPAGSLVELTVRATSASFSRLYVKLQDYPSNPPPGVMWSKASTISVFCSRTHPAILASLPSGAGVEVDNPYDSRGAVSGATEGIANLYAFACPKHQIRMGDSVQSLPVEKLNAATDIFQFLP